MVNRIKRFNIDLRKASEYVEGEFEDIICRKLIEVKLFSDQFLYSFFRAINTPRLLESGSTRDVADNIIYAFNHVQLHNPGKRANCKVSDRIRADFEDPAVAVYDKNNFNPALLTESSYGYEFINPENRIDALKGIGKILMPQD